MTQQQLYLIRYQSSHWRGGMSDCVVLATNQDTAVSCAELWMDVSMRELFSTEYAENREEGGTLDEGPAYSIDSIEDFGPEHDEWRWFLDEVQRTNFYPCIGFEFEDLGLGL